MKLLIFVVVLYCLLINPSLAFARGCTGADDCKVCKNCGYCKHCSQEGGTCGVCRSSGAGHSSRTKTHRRVRAASKHRAAVKAVLHHYNLNAPQLPNPKLTPGAVLNVTVADISVKGYTKKVRKVPQSVKDRVYAEYGITHRESGEYEVDHLIPLELGGSNDIKNLWPESMFTQPYNAHKKDWLENKLHQLVVSGKMSLNQAQRLIADNWVKAYGSMRKSK